MVVRQATQHKQAQIQAQSRRNGTLVPRKGEALDFPNTGAGWGTRLEASKRSSPDPGQHNRW